MEEGRRPSRSVTGSGLRPSDFGGAAQLHVLVVGAMLVACGSSDPVASAPRVGNVLAAVLVAADHTRSPWRCAALDTPALADAPLTTGDRHWQLGGHMLRRTDADDAVAIAVIADAADASPVTIAALARLRAELEKASPDVVLTLGGMGSTQAELEATLGTLGDHAPWPVVALPGDLEPMTEHVAALTNLRKRRINVLDGRLVRWIEQPGVTIATLPGAGARERLVASDDGCQWRAEDVAKLYTELTAKPGIRVAASSEAPRTTVEGEPAGELGLVPPQPIEVALSGPVAAGASPPRSGSRDGARIVLSPGTADGVRRLPDAHTPNAGLLVVRGGMWTWRPLAAAK